MGSSLPVEEGLCAETDCTFRNLAECALTLEGITVLNTQKENHDLTITGLLFGHIRLVDLLQKVGELLLIVCE